MLASVPDDHFTGYIAKVKADGRELSTAGAMQFAKSFKKKPPRSQREEIQESADDDDLLTTAEVTEATTDLVEDVVDIPKEPESDPGLAKEGQCQAVGMVEIDDATTSGEVKELSETLQPERTSDADGASDPMEGADEEAAPTREPVDDAAEPEDGSTLASGEGGDPAIDEPVDPPLLVQQAGEELRTVVESGTGSNHSKAADAGHSTGDPGGAPSPEVKTRRVAVEKKKRKIQHPELFPEEPLPAPLDQTV